MVKSDAGCCNVMAVVSVDAKGQIVLPKEVREKAGLKADDRLAIIGCEREGKICCIMMVRADALGGTVSRFLGPMLKDVLKGSGGEEV
jgi:AbrB family looped-hinge helix DNA binding protein